MRAVPLDMTAKLPRRAAVITGKVRGPSLGAGLGVCCEGNQEVGLEDACLGHVAACATSGVNGACSWEGLILHLWCRN